MKLGLPTIILRPHTLPRPALAGRVFVDTPTKIGYIYVCTPETAGNLKSCLGPQST